MKKIRIFKIIGLGILISLVCFFTNIYILKSIIFILFALLLFRSLRKKHNKEQIGKKVDIEENTSDYFDSLTGLYNTKGFMRYLNKYKIDKENSYIFIIDIISFKKINRLYGYDFGDEILKKVALRLYLFFTYENLIVRYENNKFIILVSKVPNIEIDNYIKSLRNHLNTSYVIDENQIDLDVYIGGYKIEEDEIILNQILYKLDFSLCEAKKSPKLFHIFNKNETLLGIEELELEIELRKGLKEGEIKPYYQPQVDIGKGEIVGFESLVRWESEERGVLTPIKFMKIAEETGLYKEIFYIVLEQVCKDIVVLKKQITSKFRVAININEIDLKDSTKLIKQIKKVLNEYNLSGEWLELELTENLVINYNESNMNFFKEIKELGISLAIDDFGTGYSSFSYLKKFPVDKIKLDKEFINDIGENLADEKIVRGIIELAKSLDIDFLIEGIETGVQLEKLKELGCNKIQGYIFGKAMPIEKVEELLKNDFFEFGINALSIGVEEI